MDDNDYLALRKKAQELRSDSPDKAEAMLRAAFEKAKKELLCISDLLEEHYSFANMQDAQEEQRRIGVRLCPDEPLAWTTLTEFLIFTKENLEEAEEAARIALKCAEKTGEYVRLCYNNLARIARRREDYKKLEECLRFLISYKPPSGKRDINYEKDFLVGIDASKIDNVLLRKYESIAAS